MQEPNDLIQKLVKIISILFITVTLIVIFVYLYLF